MRCKSANMPLKWLAVNLLLIAGYVLAQDANCDYYTTLSGNTVYTIRSPQYPNSYPRGVQCRWVADCPDRYNCRLDCTVSMPETKSCSQDRLLVSRSGDLLLNGADYYCGNGQFTSVSTGTRISVGLITAYNSSGGLFSCTLSAQQSTNPNDCTCGYKRTTRIVGGVETGVNEYPMMVGLADASIFQIKCGGVIISNRYVLTAAHCLEGYSPSNLAVITGEHNVATGNETLATAGYRISNFIPHPLYSSTNNDYDIALVRTDRDIVFSDRVGPACLPFKFANSDLTGGKLTILGWGTLFPGGPTSNVLRKVDVDVISQSSCRSAVSTLTNRQFCTYTPGKDACQDDSGGPLLYQDGANGLLFNMGIVSFGQFCATAGKPGVNTRVPALLDWIKDNTPGTYYCPK